MTDGVRERPTPEQMLARVKQEETDRHRGRLRIFFGYAAGVGKTYAMLNAAQELRAEGVDVVAGYIEPHARPETTALVDGLEELPPLMAPYRGTMVREFDVDAALARRPRVILVDELAHTNAPGLKHVKRWQDVEDLLAAGIDVYTTLNVQHVESLNDIVAQISGVAVRETIPDDVFFSADEVELIDLTPEELLERLRVGKIYIPAQAERAIQGFFRRQNLVALRELALRRTADRVHADVQAARLGAAATQTWPTTERLLVCAGPSPTSAKVIRSAKRLADAMHADWIAVTVQTPTTVNLSAEDQTRLVQHMRLAEQLGAETASLTGANVADELVAYALSRNVSKIVIGKSDPPRRWGRAKRTLVDQLLEQSGDIDVYVIRGLAEPSTSPPRGLVRARSKPQWHIGPVAASLALATGLAAAFDWLGFSEGNVVAVYLLAVFLVAWRFGRAAGILSSILAVFLFDLLFIPPYYTVLVDDSQYVVTFTVMLSVALITSTLTGRSRSQTELATINQRRTEALYRLTRSLAQSSVEPVLIKNAELAAAEVFGAEAAIFQPTPQGTLRAIVDHPAAFAANASEVAVAQWAFDRGEPAGRGTDTLPSAEALYLPLSLGHKRLGVLGLALAQPEAFRLPDQRRLLDAFAQQLAQSLDRCRLIDDSVQTQLEAQQERLRSALLSSVSHDLRTPLAVIAGASSSLLDEDRPLAAPIQKELLQTIRDEAERLARLVENLLHMTRLESGAVTAQKEWGLIEDVVGSALRRTRPQLGQRPVTTQLPEGLGLVPFDPYLIEQVLINLVDNAAKYSPGDAPIEIRAERQSSQLVVHVEDRGRGLAPGEELKLFDKFVRGSLAHPEERGAGLGLAICQAIVQAHGGRIWSENRPGGGSRFSFTLPIEGTPPTVEITDDDSAE